VTSAQLEGDAAAWDAAVAGSTTPSHLQTTAWAAIKAPNGWRSFRAVADVPGGHVGAQVLVQRPRGVPWGMGYVPRGPIMTSGTLDGASIAAFTARLRTEARHHRLGYVRMEPEAEAGGQIEAGLQRLGWIRTRHVQPESTRIIDLGAGEEALWAGLHRKCRQSVTKSERLGVRVVDADGGRLADFYAIHTEAMRRAGIATRTERTYREMWDVLAARGMARLLFAEATDTGEALAALFLVSCGGRVVDLYGGTTQAGGQRRANYLLKWEAIKRCAQAGLREYDLWGLPREGIAQFKSGFGGREVHYVGAWDLVTDRLGRLTLAAGEAARARYRRWRYRDVHRPDAPDAAEASGDG
jgi:lipid II:glycine glycyltransferase (peptidoglycan interpeptide bridge formation enzyme)